MCDKIAVNHDDFIRTTEKRHTSVVQKYLQRLMTREIFTKKTMRVGTVFPLRSSGPKRPRRWKMPETGKDVVRIKEKNYFFKMSKYRCFARSSRQTSGYDLPKCTKE